MRAKLIVVLGWVVSLALCAQAGVSEPSPPESGSVRGELARLQKKTGLTFASFYDGSVYVVDFADRTLFALSTKLPVSETERQFIKSEGTNGEVSRDGGEIALLLTQLNKIQGSEKFRYLGILDRKENKLHEYPYARRPHEFCWSYDKSRIAFSAEIQKDTTTSLDALWILDLQSNAIQQIEENSAVTSQCWSPDDQQIVYQKGDTIKVYDLKQGRTRALSTGTKPTWSPTGDQIAIRRNDTYYAVRPVGQGERAIFKAIGADSGLWWSPDARFVAYLRPAPQPGWTDLVWDRIWVRRLEGGSEDWVADTAYAFSFQWINLTSGLPR
jgi:dipeptidyl aminopeptidase/acylaminoacyl peptidase